MTLLTFSSAVKYVLTLMLAVFGIIPYEDVQVPDRVQSEPVIRERTLSQVPLEYIPGKTFSGDLSFSSFIQDHSAPELIQFRNEYPLPSASFCSFSLPEYHIFDASGIQGTGKAGNARQLIIVLTDERNDISKTYRMTSGI